MNKGAVKAQEPEVRFDRVTKVFGRAGGGDTFRAVDELSLAIGSGGLVALLGQTGCGKSTMFNMIAGLLDPTEGRVTVRGRDPFREFNWFRGRIAVVFQNDRLLPWRTALGNVELGLEMLGLPPQERRETARRWLSQLGLGGHEDDYPHALSGGMRQRVSIARAFATDAGLLLCDEPFSALDEITGQRLREDFVSLVRKSNKTAIFITHSINEALQIGDRIVVLKRPAKIAYDVEVPPGLGGENREAIRARILEVLSA